MSRTRIRSVPVRLLLALAIIAGLAVVPASAAHKVVVTQGNMGGWSIVTEGTGSALFVDGPGTPPAGGLGSIALRTPEAGDRVFVESAALAGVALADIAELSYSTYRSAGAPALSPTLQLFVDLDGDGLFAYDTDDVLTFEPYLQTGGYATVPGASVPSQCGAPCVATGAWQTWDAANGAWWTRSGGVPGPPLDTLANYAAAHPGATVALAGQAGATLKIAAGSSGATWAGFDGNVDAIAINGTLYDFEKTSLVVDCNTAIDDIATVQDAVNAARDGDTIKLSGVCDFTGAKPHGGDTASITTTAVMIRPSNPFSAGLTIESDEPGRATILGSGTQTAFLIAPNNDNVTIRGLNLIGFGRPIVVWSAANATIGDATATGTPAAYGNRITGEAMNSAILALGNNKDAFGSATKTFVYYGSGSRQSARVDNDGKLANLRVIGNYITYGAIDVPDGVTRDVVAIDVRQKNQGDVNGVEIAKNAVGFLTANFPSFNINAVRVHAHSGDPNYHLRNVKITGNNLGRLEELGDPVADVNAGGRAAIVLVRATGFEISGNGVRAFQSPVGIDMPGGGIIVSDSSNGVVDGNGIIVLADRSTILGDMGAIAVVDDVNALFGSPTGGVGSTNIKVTNNIIGPVTNDAPGLGAQRGIVVNGSSLIDVTGNNVKFSSASAIYLGSTVRGPFGDELPRAVTTTLACGNILDGVLDNPAEVLVEEWPTHSSFPGGSSVDGTGECLPAGVQLTPDQAEVSEGGVGASYQARLTIRPRADVTVTPAVGTQLIGAPSSLTFTPTNWNTPQSFTVAAVDDLLVEGTTIEDLAHATASADSTFDGLADVLPVTINDNDAGTVVLTESAGSTEVTEGGATDTFAVSLTAPPASPVTISFETDDQVSVSPSSLVFDASNFATPQTVTVSASDDDAREKGHSGSITGSSTDPLFGSIPAVLASITDNDAPAAPTIIVPVEGALFASGTVTVAGSGEPDATVEIFEGATSLGTTPVDANGSWSTVISFAPNATHTITAVLTGSDSLVSSPSGSRTFSIDTEAPAAPVISTPSTGASFGTPYVTVGGTAEPGTTLSLLANGGLKATTTVSPAGTWSIDTAFAAGTHTLTARTVDAANNQSPLSNTVSISVAMLTPTIIQPAEGSYRKAPLVIHGHAETSHDWVYLYDFGVLKEVVPIVKDVPGVWTVETSLPSGVHRLTAISRSASGTFSPPSPVRTFTVDNQPPTTVVHRPQFYTVFGVVTDGEIKGTAREGATFDSGVTRVDLVYTDITGSEVATAQASCASCPGAFVHWSHSPDLLPGFYTVQAFATDRVGNVSAAGTMTFLFLG